MYNLLMPNEEEPKVLLIGQRTSQPSRWLTFLGRTLNDEGFPTEFAGSRGLVGKLRRGKFLMAVVDWDLVDYEGSLITLIKQHAPSLKTIAAVVAEDPNTIRRVFRAGYNDIFSQNYHRDNLLATLRKRNIIL